MKKELTNPIYMLIDAFNEISTGNYSVRLNFEAVTEFVEIRDSFNSMVKRLFDMEEEKRVSFLDYFEKENTILFLDEPVHLKEKGEGVEEEFLEAQKRRAQSGYEVADSEAVLFTTQEIMRKMNEYSSVGFQALDMRCPGLNIRASYNLQTKNVDSYNRSLNF